MELYLLRHGESIKNAGQGRGSKSKNGNPGLTENGKKEIIRIAKSIKKFKITFDIILLFSIIPPEKLYAALVEW